MSYVAKVLAPDEKLIGIARLHWIYVLKGLLWFLALAAAGWVVKSIVTHFAMFLVNASGSGAMPATLLMLGDGAMYFMLAGGFLIFFFFVLKVLVTEVALSSRRVLHKEGLLFVKTQQIDLEEVRGEHLDLGWFGRVLGYGYLMLDCRFIGDIRLPAIENPERFLRALHDRRSKTQDSLAIVMGKGNPVPLQTPESNDSPDTPQPRPPQPEPEIQPSQPGDQPEADPPAVPKPEIPIMPTPHAPPPAPVPPPAPQPQPQPQPDAPPQGLQAAGQTIVVENAALDPKVVAEVVKQVMPQMAQQVAHQLVQQGIVEQQTLENDNPVDTDLANRFDEAAIDSDGPSRDNKHTLEHAIH